MKKLFLSLSLASLLGAISVTAMAASQVVDLIKDNVSPDAIFTTVFGTSVTVPLPSEYRRVFEHEEKGLYVTEWIPSEQKLESWREMITVTVAKDMKTGPQGMVDDMVEGFKQVCPKSFSRISLGSSSVAGMSGATEILSCGQLSSATPFGETVVLTIVQGGKMQYSFQWAERTTASQTPLQLDRSKWEKRLQQITRGIKVSNLKK